MYKCLSCGADFDTPFWVKEVHNELLPSAAELFAACPACTEYNVAPESYTEVSLWQGKRFYKKSRGELT